jgi:hypothetical protein
MDMAVLTVSLVSGAKFTLGPAPRDQLIARAREVFASTGGEARFTLDGEELRLGEPEKPSKSASEGPETARHGDRVLTLDDAARLGDRLLQSATTLSNQILDRAAQRGAEALDQVEKMQRRQAELQAAQAETALQQSVQIQRWVGALSATMAEERLKMAQIGSAEQQLAEQKALKDSVREVQMARISAERDIRLAQINRPNTGAVLLDLAVAFAGQFAQNAAQNFAHMNNEPKES